jgi:uncharacterized protein with von Willebrand factor type A (vWA) domain
MTTEIVMILDKSGSMSSLTNDVIGGFNTFLKEQQALKDDARLTTILFDTGYTVIHDRINIHDVKPITTKDYMAGGSTALLDALGKAIVDTKKRTSKEDKVLFVIHTDGEENASKEYNNETIKEMVTKREKKGWKFIYMGANVDAFSNAQLMGISISVNYSANKIGTQSAYSGASYVSTQMRTTKTISDTDVQNLTNMVQ